MDDRGFKATIVEQVEAKWARRTEWNLDSHALVGVPRKVTEGAVTVSGRFSATPVQYRTVLETTSSIELKNASTSLCSSAAAAPLIIVPTRAEKKRWYLASGTTSDVTTVACADVNADGVFLKTQSQAFINGFPGTQIETTVTLGPTLSSCRGIGATVTTETRAGTTRLALSGVDYNAACQRSAEYGLVSGVQKNLKSYTYGAYGLPATLSEGGIVRVYAYDATGRFLVSEKTCETSACNTGTRLVTTHAPDPETGLKLSSAGPIREGVTANPTTRYYLYDAFGRSLAVAKSPYSGEGGSEGLTPSSVTQVNEPVEAHVFSDLSSPVAVTNYRFGAALTYPLDPTGSQVVPANDNSVVASVSYLDELGREVQIRERLGANAASAAGNVVRGVTGWLVTKALLYDGAGRVRVAWDRFEAAGGAFDSPVDGLSGAGAGTRASVTNYDDEGRPWCSSVEWSPNYSVPTGLTPAGLCTSDSTESPTFALRTQTSYDIGVVSNRGPYGGNFVRTTTTPPELNLPGRNGSFETLAGPRGEVLGSVDPEMRYTWIERDPLGREIASWREGMGVSTRIPASTIGYDTAGQVTHRGDANMPTSVTNYTDYDSFGRVAAVYPDTRYQDRVEYAYGDLGRVTEVREISARFGTTRTTTHHYDVPYNGVAGEYGWTEGRLAWTDTSEGGTSITTIAYGYDDAGRMTRRDQWISAMPLNSAGSNRVSVSTTYGFDGRVLDSTVVNPYQAAGEPNPYLRYTLEYDSFGRTVDIKGRLGAMATDETFYTADGYDALGRPAVMTSDGQRGRSVRAYGAYSGALTGECKRMEGSAGTACSFASGTPLFGTEAARYEGSRLVEFTDRETKAKYGFEYFASGKLKKASAAPQTGYTGAAQDYAEEFTHNGTGNLETFYGKTNFSAAGRSKTENRQTYRFVGHPGSVLADKISHVVTAVTQGPAPSPERARYSYDVVNRLVSVTRNGASAESLFYGPTGELVYRRVGDQFHFYIGEYATLTGSCSGGTCVPAASTMEMDAHLVYAGTRIASARWRRANGLASGNPVGRILYYYRTRMGTVVATSRASVGGTASAPFLARGLMGAKYQYTPYGEVDAALTTNDSGDSRSELGYTNALRLTGPLLYLKARVYDAALRGFVQADTVDRLRYAYVWGDPVNLSDPAGLMPIADGGASADMSNWAGVHEYAQQNFVLGAHDRSVRLPSLAEWWSGRRKVPASTPARPIERAVASPAPAAGGQVEPSNASAPVSTGPTQGTASEQTQGLLKRESLLAQGRGHLCKEGKRVGPIAEQTNAEFAFIFFGDIQSGTAAATPTRQIGPPGMRDNVVRQFEQDPEGMNLIGVGHWHGNPAADPTGADYELSIGRPGSDIPPQGRSEVIWLWNAPPRQSVEYDPLMPAGQQIFRWTCPP